MSGVKIKKNVARERVSSANYCLHTAEQTAMTTRKPSDAKKRVYTMRERIIIQDWPDWWSQFRHDELARFKFNQIKPHIRAWISYLPTLSLSLFNLLKNCSRLYNEAWNQIKVSKVLVNVHDDGCQNWSDSAARHTRWLHIFFLSYFYRDTG